MATRRQANAGTSPTVSTSSSPEIATVLPPPPNPRSLAVSAKGVETGEDFARLMSALMSDVIEGRITPDISNAAVNAGGKLLKVIEMQYKYGSGAQAEVARKPFRLVAEA